MNAVKINPFMYNLLIENELNNFTVIEIRNELIMMDKWPLDSNETRKYVYRQITYFERKGWLVRIGNRKTTRYLKTDLFLSQSYVPRKTADMKFHHQTKGIGDTFKILRSEKNQCENELVMAKGELEGRC